MSPVSDFPVKLCDACLSPLQTSFDIVNGCTYRQKRRDIERSGRLGCIFCAAIDAAGQRELFESKGLSEPESCWPYRGWGWYADLESEVVLRADMRSGNFELYVLLPKPSDLGSPKLWKSVSSWFVFANPDDPAASFVDNRATFNHEIGSPESFATARQWMADCSENHAECPDPRPGKPVMLPTRLIEISALGKPESACLRDTSGRKGYYCALSYCWGVNQPFKTTLDRYEEYFRRLPYAQLPRTITDSFQVARSLGLEYIWIDSLCIIQDDQEDVNREIKEMLHVYQNAMVTISVASPSQCGEGFLYKRHKIYKSPDGPFRLPIRVDRGMMGSVFLSGFTTAWECAMEPKNKTSINYRGWTLQESALSPRLLLLTNTNMVWKCPHGFQPDLRPVPPRAREYHTKDWSRDARWKLWATKIGYEFMPHPSAIALSQPPGSESLVSAGSKVRAGWILLIENYTARELGKETDRLPAISGIAELFAPYLGGREGYRAGLWKESLVLDLGWYTPERFFTESRVTDPRVPSWSWAAAKGQVRFPEGAGLTANARLIECRTKLVSDEAPFGAVSEGQLHINGVVVQVWVDVRQTKLRDKEGKLANFDIDEGRGQWIASHGYGVTVEARCLMLATKSSLRANETIKQKETFGILLAASESHLGRYRRIGWVDFEIHDSPLWWEKLERTTITIV